MAFQSVPAKTYLESLVKQKRCKFRGLCTVRVLLFFPMRNKPSSQANKFWLKFVFSKKAKKIDEIFTVDLILAT